MKQTIAGLGVLLASVAAGPGDAQKPPASAQGVALSELAWPDAEPWLTPSAVVVIPLGAGALEQGRHLKLDSDARLARYLSSRVQAATPVVVAPSLNYHFYPAYAEYPGSTSLSEASARSLTVDAVRSLAQHGPRRFYVINTSRATLAPLSAAAKTLADAGILLGYTDPDLWTQSSAALKQTPISVRHADEAATSMMLFVDPGAVDMSKAAREYPAGRGVLLRQEQEGRTGVVSKSGTLGDATLATAQKGETLVAALVAGILSDIATLRDAPLPVARTAPPPPPAAAPASPRPGPRPEPKGQNGCTSGDERTIRNVGNMFSYFWAQLDAEALTGLFTGTGDIRHPDGTIERGHDTILANRTQLFARPEYSGSKHPVQLTDVRCLSDTAAIADGKWELRLQDEPKTTPGRGMVATRANAGWCTLILLKRDTGWFIEAWRYTVNPPADAPQPTLLSKPGFTRRGGG